MSNDLLGFAKYGTEMAVDSVNRHPCVRVICQVAGSMLSVNVLVMIGGDGGGSRCIGEIKHAWLLNH